MRAELLHDSGGDRPPVVYVPGIDGTGEFLLDTAGRLTERFRLVRLRYRDDNPPGVDGYGSLAASVAACIAEQGIGPALLLAESFGVAVALRTALDHPGAVAGLFLVNGFAYFDRRVRIALSTSFAPLVRGPVYRVGRALLATRLLFGPRRDPAARRAFGAVPALGFDGGYRDRLGMIRRLDLRPRLKEIRQPAAIFAADRDRVVAAVRAGRVMAEGIPDATLEVLSNAGHLVLPLADEPWVERVAALEARATPGRSPAP